MLAPSTPLSPLVIVQFNMRFTIAHYGETQSFRLLCESTPIIVELYAEGQPRHFYHPDQGNGRSRHDCVRARPGSVTRSGVPICGFVGHDLAANTIIVFGDREEVIWQSEGITQIEQL